MASGLVEIRHAPLVARGEGKDLCAVFGCGQHWQDVRASESGFSIAYCFAHLAQATRLFGRRVRAA